MLTKEMLMGEPYGLPEDKATEIAALSEANERETFNTKFSEIHNGFDAIVKEVAGVEKEGSEKTSDYVRRVLGLQKTEVEKVRGEKETLTTENTTLKEQIAAGSGDKGLIESQKATIAELQNSLNTMKAEKEQSEANFAKQMLDYRITAEIESAIAGVNVKKGISDEALAVLKRQAVATLKESMNPTYLKGTDGVERLVFRDGNGAELRNPDNGYNPFTAQELVTKELTKYGVVDGRSSGGGGGRNTPPAGSGILNGVRTQSQAMDAIENHLSAKGIARTSKEWQTEFDRIWTEEKVSEMPLQ